MRVKTYTGRTLSEVMGRIKSELGSEAAILSTEHKKIEGKPVCEVVAGLENKDADNGRTAQDFALGSDPVDPGWRREWETFKKSIFDLIRPGLDKSKLTSRQALGLEHLEKEGVAPELIMRIWHRLHKNGRPTLAVLDEFLETGGLETQNFPRQEVIGFCGPNGAGKSTSLIRYALECKRKHKEISVCVANADALHAGGRLFLKHYCDLSGFAYEEIASRALWGRLGSLRKKHDLVLVDIPGMTPGQDLKDWLLARGDHPEDMGLHLVLSPVYADIHMHSYIRRYSHPELKSLIWTKLDEACIFGGILNTTWRTGLPVSGFSFGIGLRDCSHRVAKKDIWRLIFKHEMPSGNNGILYE
ncbi:MAG: hypothetical protein ACLFSY_01525 [Desulfonatronovibrionaceae bacterium]